MLEPAGCRAVARGDFSGAQEALEHVMRMADGGDPDDWLFLAMSLWHRGETASARASYDKAGARLTRCPSRRSARSPAFVTKSQLWSVRRTSAGTNETSRRLLR